MGTPIGFKATVVRELPPSYKPQSAPSLRENLNSTGSYRRRPLGIPTLEDKIVQGAVAEMLSAIYEVDFLGFSYGFRPGRNPHQALDSLQTALMAERINWVLAADIRSFFDSVDHEWMLAHRVANPRVLRLVRCRTQDGAGAWSSRDVRLSGFYASLRQDPERTLHRLKEDAAKADDPQAQRNAA